MALERPDGGRGRPQRILLVEDDDDAREVLAVLLAERGFETVTAEDGDRAMEAGAEFRPDVLLCDWQLAGSDDGVAVAARLQARHDVPVVFLTAHSVSELRHQARHLNVLACLSKPIDIDRLVAIVESAPNCRF